MQKIIKSEIFTCSFLLDEAAFDFLFGLGILWENLQKF